MSEIVSQIEVRLRISWWVIYYMRLIVLWHRAFGTMPDIDVVKANLTRGVFAEVKNAGRWTRVK